jgi:integrase
VADLHAILALDDAGSLQVARDKAMIALGFGHALRGPSELLELDYIERGEGRGSLEVTRAGLVVHLATSKTSDDAEALTIDSAAVQAAVARWVALAGIQAGEPLFQSFKRNGRPTGKRLGIDGLTMALRDRVADALVAQGQSREAAVLSAQSYSTHSLRRGAATAMARNGATPLEIAGITRHKSLAMVQRYCDAGGQKYAPMRKLGL